MPKWAEAFSKLLLSLQRPVAKLWEVSISPTLKQSHIRPQTSAWWDFTPETPKSFITVHLLLFQDKQRKPSCVLLYSFIYAQPNSSESRVFFFLLIQPDTVFETHCCRPHVAVTYNYTCCAFEVLGLILSMSYLSACSPPRPCPVMSRRAHTLPPTSTGCTVGLQAAMWPRATTIGSRRARPCPTQAAGWACMQGRSTRRWPSSTRPEKVDRKGAG